ncbi:Formin-like protein 18 [Citrus sinensis]|uniref:Formin-like protein 18 n=1 Tax=Citrus sinensis TaxID=2711 RepID=A0ACB8NLL7_CITSI|nr:Formin-like protein 18 [Citrus sinensis]
MVFNFREGEHQSQIGQVLSEYDMTVMDYPRHYEGCPLLTMETVHHFLRSSESWLSLGHQNVLLMHCERGGWPVLAFMLAALLIYRKQFTGEQKTLDMIYKQAPRELLQLMSPLNPLPSQLRYLQYVSRRNVGSEWPPLDRALTLDCVILRVIPNFDGEGGCCPIFRIYGQDPLMVADRTPKVLFSTPKRSKLVRHYKQHFLTLNKIVALDVERVFGMCEEADCELVKIDIHCHIQGDVVLECISLDSDQEREEMMFRVMFNTAFIRSNILMLNRDEIDILWNSKDLFSKEFRAEVLFSEMDAATSLVSVDLPGIEEKDGLPIEAFAKVQEIFSNVDWLDPKLDVAVNMLQHFTPSNFIQENLETALNAEKGSIMIESALEKDKEQLKLKAPDNIGGLASISQGKPFMPSVKPALDANSFKKKNEPKELLVSLQQPAQPKIISPRLPQTSSSASQGSPISRYHSAPSSLGITALLHDHDKYIQEITQQVKRSQPAVPTSPSVTNTMRPPQPSHVSTPSPTPPPLPFQPPSARASLVPPKIIQKTQVTPPPPLPTLKATQSFLSEQPETTSQSIEHLLSDPSTTSAANSAGGTPVTETLHSDAPSPPPSFQETSPSPMFEHSSTTSTLPPPPPPPPHSFPGMSQSFVVNNSFSIPPPPPPPPPPHSFPGMAQSFVVNNSFSIPPPSSPPSFSRISSTSSSDKNSFSAPSPPPQPPSLSGISPTSSAKNLFSTPPPPPPPPPPSPSPFSVTSPSTSVKNSFPNPPPPPPPPSPPPSFLGTSLSSIVNNSVSIPPPPPLPPMVASSTTSSVFCPLASKSSAITSRPPPPPPPPLHSRGSTSMSLARPPPQLPASNLPPENSLSHNSAPVPPVPPPPAPFAKGLSLSKANDVTPPSHSGVSNGNIPPIPGPPSGAPFSAKMRGLAHASPRLQSQPRKNNLKPYHWLKLTRAMQGSLWAEAQKSDEASKAPEFDMSELESLFSAAAPNSDLGGKSGKSNRRSGPKPERVQLIELRRANNCEIMLTKVKIPLPDLMGSVLALDDSALDIDQVDNLIKFCPTKEEMEVLKFFLELMKVPRVESKLRVFSFKIQFQTQVRNSIKLKRIMQTILSLGNALNHGTARGSAVGFRLDSLLKLTDTRARNNKMTLMHYLCKVLAEKLPELLGFPKDLVSLEASTKIQLKFLAEEMQAISKGLEKVVQELTASENDGEVSGNFCKLLKEFLSYAEGEVRSLALLYSSVGRNADALAQYFGEDPARCPFEQVVSTLLNFVKMFVLAHEENCRQLEFERKKAEKAVENEKLKTQKGQSEHLVRCSKIKIGKPVTPSNSILRLRVHLGQQRCRSTVAPHPIFYGIFS